MAKVSELKRGQVVEFRGEPYVVGQIDVKSPSSRGANTLYKIRFNHATTGQKFEDSFKGDDQLGHIDLLRRAVQFSYREGDEVCVFMDEESYEQYRLDAENLGAQIDFLEEGLTGITAMLIDGAAVAIELPQSIVMAITETAPGIKGASASARTKPATFATGLIVQVPEYLESGERVRINTQDRRYMARA